MIDLENFINPTLVSSKTFDYFGIDSPEHWDEHWKTIRKTLPDSYYDDSNKNITYTFNKHGFRYKELDTVDWDNFALFLGCSNTFGQGVPEDLLANTLVETQLGIDCINLCVPGGSNSLMSTIALDIASRNLKPKFVVVNWTTHDRIYDIVDSKIENLGIWSLTWYKTMSNNSANFYKNWATSEERTLYYSLLAQKQIKQFFPNTLLLESSFSQTVAEDLDCHFVNNNKNARARDGYHEGYKYHEKLSDWILENV